MVVASNISIFFDKGPAKTSLKTQPVPSTSEDIFETKTSISGSQYGAPIEKRVLKTQASDTSNGSLSKNLVGAAKKSALRIKLPSHSLYSQGTPKGDGLVTSSKKLAKQFANVNNK